MAEKKSKLLEKESSMTQINGFNDADDEAGQRGGTCDRSHSGM